MMKSFTPRPPLLEIIGQPCPAVQSPEDETTAIVGTPTQAGEILARLVDDESALYAMTREWRYETAGRRFVRLHALLDEQFSEIGVRLTRLAARSRELGTWHSTGHGDGAAQPRAAVDDARMQPFILRALLGVHEALVVRLKHAHAAANGRFQDRETTHLLAELCADHERDAFSLRALLWEVENVT